MWSKRSPRVACLLSHRYPVESDRAIYLEIDKIAEVLDAEARVFHSMHADPIQCAEDLRGRIDSQFFVPPNPMFHWNDAEYWRSCHGPRLDSVLEALAGALGKSAVEVYHQREVQAALSCARWALAWQPDLVCTWHLGEPALSGLVTAMLLGVPLVCMMHSLEGSRYHALLDLFADRAQVVVVSSASLYERLNRAAVRGRVIEHDSSELLPLLRAQLGRGANGPRGAEVAFRAPVADVHVPQSKARPCLILGTERTGTNMLSEMLCRQPGVTFVGELFNPRFIKERHVPWMSGSDTDQAMLLWLRAHDPVALHARLLADADRALCSLAGLKLLYVHLMFDDRVLRLLATNPHMPVLHMRRKDHLARWVSFRRATETDSWFSRKSDVPRRKAHPVELEPLATLNYLSLSEKLEARFASVVDDHPVLDIDYTEFVADMAGGLQRICRHLGFEAELVEASSRKTGSHDVRRDITNYEQLYQAFSGTRWESVFQHGEEHS